GPPARRQDLARMARLLPGDPDRTVHPWHRAAVRGPRQGHSLPPPV
ncbi:MAG: hypothetical protein AVDCRST_MAG50-2061, partial [uncultured Acidimicrobiales bacterium]